MSWIDNAGGPYVFSDDARVDFVRRDGGCGDGRNASYLRWEFSKTEPGYDILRYRVVQGTVTLVESEPVVAVYNPVVCRERVKEINLEIAALKGDIFNLEEERTNLLKNLHKEGFALIDFPLEVEDEKEAVLRVGDEVELVSKQHSDTGMRVGDKGKVTALTFQGRNAIVIDDSWLPDRKDLKLIKRGE